MKLKSVFLILGVLFFLSACNNTPSRTIKEASVVFKKEASLAIFNLNGVLIKEYDIELADTPYMNNTLISLDLIFLNESLEIISIYKNTTPYDESSIPSLAQLNMF
ncbi:MAG: DUF192 domain-containing protein [Flavobacteriaceae bacterium]|nr:DUF192 domain-containing protein [Flavobacteriaceae bacterium]MDG1711896.1 DUF192 domain-containing protein [Flavobacteriaceae bacterium]